MKLKTLLLEGIKQKFPSEIIGALLKLSLSKKYKFPSGYDEHKVAELFLGDRLPTYIVKEIQTMNPDIRIPKKDYGWVLMGICSRFLPEDIYYFEKFSGMSGTSSDYKTAWANCNDRLIKEFGIGLHGYVPSQRNLIKIENRLNELGI